MSIQKRFYHFYVYHIFQFENGTAIWCRLRGTRIPGILPPFISWGLLEHDCLYHVMVCGRQDKRPVIHTFLCKFSSIYIFEWLSVVQY